jgi:SET domain-containing protein
MIVFWQACYGLIVCSGHWCSCDPNLKMFRVYVETTYKWLPHIGFYAMRDIEAGEELAYNYNYGRLDEENEQEKHCREWLLVHTDVES